MAKKIYEVIRQETVTEYLYLEATSEDNARELAEQGDFAWESGQNGESHIMHIGVAIPKLLHNGMTIETKIGPYTYNKKEHAAVTGY